MAVKQWGTPKEVCLSLDFPFNPTGKVSPPVPGIPGTLPESSPKPTKRHPSPRPQTRKEIPSTPTQKRVPRNLLRACYRTRPNTAEGRLCILRWNMRRWPGLSNLTKPFDLKITGDTECYRVIQGVTGCLRLETGTKQVLAPERLVRRSPR